MYGVDTRALTKLIREEGSMLGRMLLQKPQKVNGVLSDSLLSGAHKDQSEWARAFEQHEWTNPNVRNLVADGKYLFA
jgi:carbamoyl-phosphate synthase/aspartate carbamoyltransferase